MFEVDNAAHARFNATERAYHYHIHFHKDPFKLNRSWLYKGELDMDAMNEAAEILLTHTDFSCFSKSNTQTFTNNCKITAAFFEEKEGWYTVYDQGRQVSKEHGACNCRYADKSW